MTKIKSCTQIVNGFNPTKAECAAFWGTYDCKFLPNFWEWRESKTCRATGQLYSLPFWTVQMIMSLCLKEKDLENLKQVTMD